MQLCSGNSFPFHLKFILINNEMDLVSRGGCSQISLWLQAEH